MLWFVVPVPPTKSLFEKLSSRTRPRWVGGAGAPLVVKCGGGRSKGRRGQGRSEMPGGTGRAAEEGPFLLLLELPSTSLYCFLFQKDDPVLSYFRRLPAYT